MLASAAWGAFSDQRCPAGLYGLGNGSRFSIENLSFGMGSPKQASRFVQRRGRACSSGYSPEVFGKHGFSYPRPEIDRKGAAGDANNAEKK